jgi:4-amino-4-deoxy-L-arabinose transferase-like glycosyltransferase
MPHRMNQTSTVKPFLRREWAFIAVLLLAAFLRLQSLDLIDLRYDEASAPQFALSITQGQWLSFAPFSGSVANHPPVYLYVLALPYLFTRDLLAVAAYRALLDVAAVALLWWLCVRFFNRRVALLSSLFFAVAPWAIQYARKLWLAPLALFSVVLLFGLLEVLKRRNAWGWAIVGWGIALCVGCHLSAIYLVPVTLVVLLLGWRTLRPLPVLVGLAPIVILCAVYLTADAAQGFSNVNALWSAFHSAGTFSWDSLNYAFWTSGGTHLSDLTDGAYAHWQAQVPEVLNGVDLLQMILLGAALLMVTVRSLIHLVRRQWQPMAVDAILALWWLIPVLMQLQHSKPLQLHYLTPLYPVPFLLMALLVDQAITWKPASLVIMRSVKALVGTFVAAILLWQVLTTFRFTDFIARYDTSVGGYGLPVRSALKVAQVTQDCQAIGKCEATPGGLIVVTPGGDPLVNEQATIFNVVLAGIPHRFANSDAGLILRPDVATYIFTPGSERAKQALDSQIRGGAMFTQSIPLRSGSPSSYEFVYLTAPVYTHTLTAPAAQWANGTQLAGYQTAVSDKLNLSIVLSVTQGAPAGADYHWYNHVLSGSEKIAQLDGGGIQASNWRQGDLLLHWFDIPLPQPTPQHLSVRIGSYTFPAIQSIPVTFPDGSMSDGVELDVK